MDRVDREYLGELFGLAGRTALITGARHGLGRAVAVALARAGAEVAVTGRDPQSLDGVCTELRSLGADPLALPLELTDPQSIDDAVSAVTQRFGRLDILINNAGVSIRRPAFDYSIAEWDAVMNGNLRGAFLISRAAAAQMRAGGRIINISSTFARAAIPERAPYAASKAALEHLTRVLALEWASRDVLVNAVAPGLTDTETRREVLADPAVRAERTGEIPLGRIGAAPDVVGAVLLLAGPAGSFITGTTVVVDGGYTLGSST